MSQNVLAAMICQDTSEMLRHFDNEDDNVIFNCRLDNENGCPLIIQLLLVWLLISFAIAHQ